MASLSFWTYRQIRHFLTSHAHHTNWTRQLTPFESLCHRKTPQRHLISLLYTLLSETPTQAPAPSQIPWSRDLQISLTTEEWNTIHDYADKGSLNVAIQENCYKVVIRWYRTPRLHKFSRSIPDTCWSCGMGVGSMLHVWWDCVNLQPFWSKVHDLNTHITTFTLDYTLAQFLLHHTSLSKRINYKSLAMHLVNAARLCVPKHWRSTCAPTIREWFARISKIKDMEELIHISQDRMQEFSAVWACWINFTTTERFRQYFPFSSLLDLCLILVFLSPIHSLIELYFPHLHHLTIVIMIQL